MLVNGNDAEASYLALKEAMDYVRNERKPLLLEAKVSRLYGHSSASGCVFEGGEDPLELMQNKLASSGLMTQDQMKELREKYEHEFRALADKVKDEPQPDPETIYDYTYWQQTGKYW